MGVVLSNATLWCTDTPAGLERKRTCRALLCFAPRSDSQEKAPGCVWVLNPRDINSKVSSIGEFVPIYSDASLRKYIPALWDERAVLPAPPVAFDPPSSSPRISAQRGKFTVHGRSRKPLESYRGLKVGLQRIEIPAKNKVHLRRQFLLAGVSESMLFPGIGGVASEITRLASRRADQRAGKASKIDKVAHRSLRRLPSAWDWPA
jgi:hypothetical protein